MALTPRQKRARNAEYQQRWRDKQATLARANPYALERELMLKVERCERGELSDPAEPIALADQLADLMMDHFRSMNRINHVVTRLRRWP